MILSKPFFQHFIRCFLFPVPDKGNPCHGDPLTIDVSFTGEGEIRSPSFMPSDDNRLYPNDLNCKWQLEVDEGLTVSLTFTEFDLELG